MTWHSCPWRILSVPIAFFRLRGVSLSENIYRASDQLRTPTPPFVAYDVGQTPYLYTGCPTYTVLKPFLVRLVWELNEFMHGRSQYPGCPEQILHVYFNSHALCCFAILSRTLQHPEDPCNVNSHNFPYCKADRDFVVIIIKIVRDFHGFLKSRCHS